MAKELTPIDIERAAERIRQEKETFDQRKKQDSLWFVLKLVMGFFSVIMLAVILVIAAYILINNEKFPLSVNAAAVAALFVDMLGLIISVWKIVLNPNSTTKLEPVIKQNEE
jgi:fucose 4-O-acetylase-like acetyltransferase